MTAAKATARKKAGSKTARSKPSISGVPSAQLVKKFGKGAQDTGSTEVQVAIITSRINELNEHFKTHAKDVHSKRGLLKLVGKRRRLLKYLRGCSETRYTKLLGELELRK